jgi:hypothetical protein
MSGKRNLGLAGMLSIAALVFAPAAPAATEVGSNCAANQAQPNSTLVQLYNRPGAELPIAAPSGGVLTQWRVKLGLAGSLPLQLKVLEPGGYPNDFHVVAESPVITGSTGQNVIDSRLPVEPGYRFSLYSQDGHTPYCRTAFEDVMGYALGDAQVTSTYTFPMEGQAQVPVVARIEPDVDGDGYGDETQDACPQSASVHLSCPVASLSFSTKVKKKRVVLQVSGTTSTDVTVTGMVPLGRGRRAQLKGGTRAVASGAFTRFTLKFPAKLTRRLEELPPNKKLTLRVIGSAPNIAAAPTIETTKVKLKGQAKP